VGTVGEVVRGRHCRGKADWWALWGKLQEVGTFRGKAAEVGTVREVAAVGTVGRKLRR